MQAREATFFELLEGEKQLRVPPHRSAYGWGQREWAALWDDVRKQTTAPGKRRFWGAVLLSSDLGEVGDLKVVHLADGQQRLTTWMLLGCAVRDRLRENAPREAERFQQQCLVNEFQDGLRRYRLLPSEEDRKAFTTCVNGSEATGVIGAAHRFFRNALGEHTPGGDVVALKRVAAAMRDRLSLLEITADDERDVPSLLASLGLAGTIPTTPDPLRGLLPSRHELLWGHLRQELHGTHLHLLLRLDPAVRGERDADRAQRRRWAELADRADDRELETEVAELVRRARLLRRAVEPEREPTPVIREALERLRDWDEQGLHLPLTLHLLDLRDCGAATPVQVARALGHIEDLLVHRVTSGVPDSSAAAVLERSPEELESALPVDEAVERHLAAKRAHWPSNERRAARLLEQLGGERREAQDAGGTDPEPAPPTVSATHDPVLGAEFQDVLDTLLLRIQAEADHDPADLIADIDRRDAVTAVKQMIKTPYVSELFETLSDLGRLDLAPEALVLEPRFAPLFTTAEISVCRGRLERAGETF